VKSFRALRGRTTPFSGRGPARTSHPGTGVAGRGPLQRQVRHSTLFRSAPEPIGPACGSVGRVRRRDRSASALPEATARPAERL